MLFYFCEIFKTTFFTEPLRVTTPGSSDHYLKAYQNDINWGNNIWLFICCKTKLKKKFFFWKNICVFYKIYIICRKKCFYMGKKFYNEKFFYWKKLFYREKYKWKCKNVYISFEKYIFMQKMFVLQIKYKSFLNIYSFCKKNFFWS